MKPIRSKSKDRRGAQKGTALHQVVQLYKIKMIQAGNFKLINFSPKRINRRL